MAWPGEAAVRAPAVEEAAEAERAGRYTSTIRPSPGRGRWQPRMAMETYFRYDAKGSVLEEKQLHGAVWLYTDYTYETFGNRLSTTDSLGRTTYFRYSSAYQSAYLTKTSGSTGTQNVTSTYTYDFGTGFLLSQTDPNGFVTSYSYDLLGRTTGVTYPAEGGISASMVYLYDDHNTTHLI